MAKITLCSLLVNKTLSFFQVILEATRGSDYRGDISLDDLYVKDGNCVGLCSSVTPTARVRCGTYGITSGRCKVTYGCCYDDSIPNVPACFQHPASCLAVPVSARTACGTSGISRTACQNLGCCYDANGLGGVRCYNTLAKPTPFPSTQAPVTTPAPSPYDCNFDGKDICSLTDVFPFCLRICFGFYIS